MFGYGLGLFLLVVGAILRFAVNKHVSGIDMPMIGNILMIAGAAALLLSFIFNMMHTNRRAHRTVEQVNTPNGTVVEEDERLG